MTEKKNRITDPNQATIDVFVFYGLALLIAADLYEGGQILFINGLDNLVGQPVPGLKIGKGAMVVVIPADMAQQIRGQQKQVQAEESKKKGLIH